MKKLLKFLGAVLASFVFLVILFIILLFTGVIWRSPKFYPIKELIETKVPIMSMDEYSKIDTHPVPYNFEIKSTKGSVRVVGITHTRDPKDFQIDSLNARYTSSKVDVVLVEGRLGFLFEWFQNEVEEHGADGRAMKLAKQNGIPYYTWEPNRNEEINYLLKKYNPKQVALFYSLRPYISNFRFGKPSDPAKTLMEYVNSRTDYDLIRGQITSITEIDSIWKADFPKEKDWRDTSDEFGFPEGYIGDIWSDSNIYRDKHMCSIIIELVRSGKNALITMGASHAIRIEDALKSEIK